MENFAELFKKNMSDTIKLFQDTTKKVIDTQSKQLEFTTEIYKKSIATLENFNKNSFNDFFTPEKALNTIQKYKRNNKRIIGVW